MKKTAMIVAAIMGCAALSSCGGVGNRTTTSQGNSGTSVLDNVLGAVANGQTIGNVLGSVLGTDKPKESDLIGTWKYRQPGVAFSSENTLAKAGGEAIAAEIKEKLSNTYSKVGFSASNTYLTFNSDKTFTGKLDGKSISGTWTYESSDQKLTLKPLLFSINCYAKKTTGGMSFLMESKKLLTLLQTAAKLSGNNTLQTIGNISQNYDGVRMGFDMKK